LGGVIHGSNPCAVAKFESDRAALEAVWQTTAHGKIINLIPSLLLLSLFFLLLLADLTLLALFNAPLGAF
jgi:hypothetical protein